MCMRFDETGRVAPHLLPLHRQGSALEHRARLSASGWTCVAALHWWAQRLALLGSVTGADLHWRTLSTDTWFYMGPGVLLRGAFGKGFCHLLGTFGQGCTFLHEKPRSKAKQSQAEGRRVIDNGLHFKSMSLMLNRCDTALSLQWFVWLGLGLHWRELY